MLSRRGDERGEKLPDALYRKIDVTDRKAVAEAVAEGERSFGPVGCLVNNAGVMLLGLLHEQNPDEWERMVQVNLMGVFHGIHAVLPGMVARKSGTIIQVSSMAGRTSFTWHAAYCATKFAVHGLTETMAKEVAPHGVRSVIISPGVVETELLGHTTDAKIKRACEMENRRMGKLLSSEDVAESIWFAYSQPPHVCIREIILSPTRQE